MYRPVGGVLSFSRQLSLVSATRKFWIHTWRRISMAGSTRRSEGAVSVYTAVSIAFPSAPICSAHASRLAWLFGKRNSLVRRP